MCGINFLLARARHTEASKAALEEQFAAALAQCADRGRETTQTKTITFPAGDMPGREHVAMFGFNRLAINGLDHDSDQPIQVTLDGVRYTLICNGEIYNYRQLAEEYGFSYTTHSDCESIIHLYHYMSRIPSVKGGKYHYTDVLQLLDGVFAFVLCVEHKRHANILVGRDRFGVRPLFVTSLHDEPSSFLAGSTLKTLAEHKGVDDSIIQFVPGYCQMLTVSSAGIHKEDPFQYYNAGSIRPMELGDRETERTMVRSALWSAVRKRVANTDRPIACLLSGGLDSSLIASMVSVALKEKYDDADYCVETYSIGLEGSVDLKYARIVAEHIGSDHHEVVVTEEEFLAAIPETIRTIESYDTTTVRASVGNRLIAKYISENSPSGAKVIFNGDGSDEVAGGYLYFSKAPTPGVFDDECKRLLSMICFFDVLRSDRSIASNNLEARTPFLDAGFVQAYLSTSIASRRSGMEKQLLREAMNVEVAPRLSGGDDERRALLPDEVLWRRKEAFSDGVSGMERSWTDIIKERLRDIPEHDAHADLMEKIAEQYFAAELTPEQLFYRAVFRERFGRARESIIPGYWMPKFVEASDASARTLALY